jgi:hypothetical protein
MSGHGTHPNLSLGATMNGDLQESVPPAGPGHVPVNPRSLRPYDQPRRDTHALDNVHD